MVPLGPTAVDVAEPVTEEPADLWAPSRSVFPGLAPPTPAPGTALEAPSPVSVDVVLAGRRPSRIVAARRRLRRPRRQGGGGLRWLHRAGRLGLRWSDRRRRPLVLGVAAVLVLALVAVGLGLDGTSPTSVAPSALHRVVPRGGPTTTPHARPAASSSAAGPHSSLPSSAFAHATPAPEAPASTSGAGTSGAVASPGPSGAAAPGDLSPADASLVAAHWEQERSSALASGSAATLGTLDTGPALQGDQAVSGQPPASLQLAAVQVLDGTLPRSFVAAFETPGAAGEETLVFFSQPTDSSPWRAELEVSVAAGLEPTPSAPGTTPAAVSPAALRALASAWQAWAASGRAPSSSTPSFVSSGAYSAIGQAVVAQEAASTRRGLDEAVTFTAEPGSLPFVEGGRTVAICGAVLETAVYRSANGAALVESASGTPWAPGLAAGSYPTVTQQAVAQVCVVSDTAGAVVIGRLSGPFTTTG